MAEEGEGGDQLATMTVHEETELRRVYDLLCNFAITKPLKAEIALIDDRLSKLDPNKHEDIAVIAALSEQIGILQNGEKEKDPKDPNRKVGLKEYQDDPNRKVREEDVMEALDFLGKKKTQPQEVKDMIWEVDENLDGCVDWKEFQLMFLRNISDTTGLEPSKFYNLVQFMIYDKDSRAMVSVDNTMKMLYERYGRAKMELKLKELFGTDMKEAGKGGGEINFFQYCSAVDRLQIQAFNNSTVGKLLQQTKNKGL